jgi:tetratricopeptide (TPR) repeat protein
MTSSRLLAAGVLAILSFIFSAAPAAPADDPARAAFQEGNAAFQAEDYETAINAFRAAISGGLTGPAVHYNLGVSAYRLGRYSEAEAAFRQVMRTPSMAPLARYNLGLVRLAVEDTEGARRWFEHALDEGGDPRISELAGRQLQQLPARTEGPGWWVYASVGGGYDDNVALIADGQLIDVSGLDSPFAEGQFAASAPIGARLRIDGGAYTVRYSDLEEFNQTAVYIGGAWIQPIGQWASEAAIQVGYNYLDGENFEDRVGIALQGVRPLSEYWRLRLRYRYDDLAGSAPFEDLTGARQLIAARLSRAEGLHGLHLEYSFETNDRDDASVSPDRHMLDGEFRWNAGRNILSLGASFRRSEYDFSDGPGRDEDRVVLALGLAVPVWRRAEISLGYDYTRNQSNLDEFDYTRNRATLGVNVLFSGGR